MTHYEIFNNGTELLIAETGGKQAAIQVWLRVGTDTETAEQAGLAHFLEHMLFKGTTSRRVGEICQLLENWGGNLNAYTSYDRTVYFLTIPAQHVVETIGLLHDAIYHSVIDNHEFACEREVIIEEINEYQDDPASRIQEEAIRRAFSGQVHPILGHNAETLRAFQRDDLEKFYRCHYQPTNIALVVVGAVDTTVVREHAQALFSNVINANTTSINNSPPIFSDKVQGELLYGDYRQPSRFIISLPAPPRDHVDRFAFELLSFFLGCGDTSRLNTIVRDEQRLATVITSNYHASNNWGLLEINALTPFDKTEQAISSIAKVIARCLADQPPTLEELRRASTNAKVDYAQQNETVSGLAGNLGYGLLTNQKHLHSDYYFAMLDRITPTLIQQALHRWLGHRQAVIVGALANDKKGKLSASQLVDAYNETSPAPRSVGSYVKHQTIEPQLSKLNNGVELIYQQNKQSKLSNIVAATAGGLVAETAESNGLYNALAQMLGQETAKHSYQQMVTAIEGHGAQLDGFSGKDSIGLQLQCLQEDSEFFAPLFAECLREARFPDPQWQTVQDEITDTIALREEHPSSFCMQRFNEQIFIGHPYALPIAGDSPIQITPQLLAELHCSLHKQQWVVAVVSPLAESQIRELVEMMTSHVSATEPRFKLPTTNPLESTTHTYEKKCQQQHLICGFQGLSWNDSDRYPLDVLSAILDGSSGRLFMRLREKKGLAYSVSPITIYGIAGGAFGAHICCDSNKEQLALAGMEQELSWSERPTVSEVARAKNFIIGNHQWEMAMGDKQAMHLALMQLHGVGYRDVNEYSAKIKAVTEQDLARVIDRLVSDQPRITIKVGVES